MTVRPDGTAPRRQTDAGHRHLEDRHGGPDGARHPMEVERLERLVRAAQEVSDRAAHAQREHAGQDGQDEGGGVASQPAPRMASVADLERADNEGMHALEDR